MNSNESRKQPQKPPDAAPCPAGEPAPPKTIPFDALAEGHTEVLIEFHGQIYRLRSTRNKKLILNK